MKFTWDAGHIDSVEMEFGQKVVGLQQQRARPNKCWIEPDELLRYLRAHDDVSAGMQLEALKAYVHNLQQALARPRRAMDTWANE